MLEDWREKGVMAEGLKILVIYGCTAKGSLRQVCRRK